jgi:hypothetical protein
LRWIGRTYVSGSNRTCDGYGCAGFLRIECERGAGAPATNAATDFRGLLLATAWTWIDNGTPIGTMTFFADGNASATWINVSQVWRIDPNGDLMLYADGTRWVVRLTFDPATRTFSGRRDATSQVQDGVLTVLRPAGG